MDEMSAHILTHIYWDIYTEKLSKSIVIENEVTVAN